MKEFGSDFILTKWQQWELRHVSLIRCLYMHWWCLHGPINSYHSVWWSNLILCIYNVNTLNICMKEFGSDKIIFGKMTAVRTLDKFSLIRLLYMHRWCLHGPINSYYSFWWNNLILCRYNVNTLNICMKENGSQKISLTKWQLWELRQVFPNKALYMHRWRIHGPINSYHSF